MALFLNYGITNQDVYLVVKIDWKLTAGGATFHTDTWRYDLTDRALGNSTDIASRIVREVKERAVQINTGVVIYQGVQAALTVPQGQDVQIL